MLYFFISLATYIFYHSNIISCLGTFIFFFIMFTSLFLFGFLNVKLYNSVIIQSELTMLISLLIWLRLYNLINLFECLMFSFIFHNVFKINYNFLKKDFVNKNKNLFLLRNKLNIYEEINIYKKIILNISCFH